MLTNAVDTSLTDINELGKAVEAIKSVGMNEQLDWSKTKNILRDENVQKLMEAAGIKINFVDAENMEISDGKRGLITNSIAALFSMIEQGFSEAKNQRAKEALRHLNNFFVRIWKIQNGRMLIEDVQSSVSEKAKDALKDAA